MIKRTFDVVASAVGLLLLWPLLLIVACFVKVSSRGPVLFRHERMGRAFRPFRLLKFRTMAVSLPGAGSSLTVGQDPRITKVGRWLRALKVDELPQLWNVLRGDMSLVGPRPEVPEIVERFRSDYEQVLRIRPGITDLASLKYWRESELLGLQADPRAHYEQVILPDKLALARRYIGDQSFFLDLSIVFRSIFGMGPPRRYLS